MFHFGDLSSLGISQRYNEGRITLEHEAMIILEMALALHVIVFSFA